MSPGRWARLPGMFSTQGTNAAHRDGGPQLGDGAHGADHRRAAGHVVLHLLHAVGGLDGNTAGIEGDALADQSQVSAALRVRGPVTQHDQHRRFGAADGHAEQRTHAEFLHGIAIQDFALQSEFRRHLSRGIGHGERRQPIGRLVDQVAAEILRFGQNPAALDSGIQTGRIAGHRERLDRFLVVALLVAVGLEIAQDGAFDRGRSEVVAGKFGIQGEGDVLDRFGLQIAQRGPAQAAHFGGVEFLRLARPRQQDPGGAHARRMVEQGQFERLSGDFP